jgi:hypothetical protein
MQSETNGGSATKTQHIKWLVGIMATSWQHHSNIMATSWQHHGNIMVTTTFHQMHLPATCESAHAKCNGVLPS